MKVVFNQLLNSDVRSLRREEIAKKRSFGACANSSNGKSLSTVHRLDHGRSRSLHLDATILLDETKLALQTEKKIIFLEGRIIDRMRETSRYDI